MRISIIFVVAAMLFSVPECSAAKKSEKQGMKCEQGCKVKSGCEMHDCCCSADKTKCEKCLCSCIPCGCAERKMFCDGAKHEQTCTKTSHVNCAKAACAKMHPRK